jgi:hypothetical protein
VEEPPGEGSDVVKELEGLLGSFGIDGPCADEELEMSVDLCRRGVCDSVMVIAIST